MGKKKRTFPIVAIFMGLNLRMPTTGTATTRNPKATAMMDTFFARKPNATTPAGTNISSGSRSATG